MKNKRLILVCSALLSASLFATAITVPIVLGSESVSDVVNNNPVKNPTELNNWFGSTNFKIHVSNDVHSNKSKNELESISNDTYVEVEDFEQLTSIIGVDVTTEISNKPNNIKYKYKLSKIIQPQSKIISSTIYEFTLSVVISASFSFSSEQTNSNPKTFKITSNIVSTLQSELDNYTSTILKVDIVSANGAVSEFDNLVQQTSSEWVELDATIASILGITIDDDNKRPEDVLLKFQLVKDETEIETNSYQLTIKAETVDGKSSLTQIYVLTAV